MLKIQSGQFIEVSSTQGYDTMGQPEVQVTIEGNFELTNMRSDLMTLQNDMAVLQCTLAEEARLRKENPALKDIHDKYQIVYELVKKADSGTRNGSNV